MIILGINSATARAAVAVVKNAIKKIAKTRVAGNEPATVNARAGGKTRPYFAKSWESNRDEGEKLLPAVQLALKALKKEKPDLIFVVRGPGSFTGLRIGVTVANMLASVLSVKVSSIDTFEYLRARVPVNLRKKTAVILKAGGEFVAVMTPRKKTSQRLNKAELAGFFRKHPTVKSAVSDMSRAEMEKIALPKGIKWLGEKELSGIAEVIVELAKGLRAQKMVSPKYLLPPKITKSKKPAFTGAR